jgi:large subunit ribosomal protein L27
MSLADILPYMASTKAAGTAKNLTDSNPKYLGVKRADGAFVNIGEIIVRQRGTKIMAGKNVAVAKDHTLFSMITGIVKFATKRKGNFDGRSSVRSIVSVSPKA